MQQLSHTSKQCYEKFLMYGYAAEYKTFWQNILGQRAPKALLHGLCLLLSGLCSSCLQFCFIDLALVLQLLNLARQVRD